MYTACLFCNVDLGQNRALPTFPVGTRLAFDAERGRLWVICVACDRWNLSPLDERWQAIEECERRGAEAIGAIADRLLLDRSRAQPLPSAG